MSIVYSPRGLQCLCRCHRESPLVPFMGVAVTDPIEAVTACVNCERHHCSALLERRIWDDREPKQITPWQDPPPDSGEGAES